MRFKLDENLPFELVELFSAATRCGLDPTLTGGGGPPPLSNLSRSSISSPDPPCRPPPEGPYGLVCPQRPSQVAD